MLVDGEKQTKWQVAFPAQEERQFDLIEYDLNEEDYNTSWLFAAKSPAPVPPTVPPSPEAPSAAPPTVPALPAGYEPLLFETNLLVKGAYHY